MCVLNMVVRWWWLILRIWFSVSKVDNFLFSMQRLVVCFLCCMVMLVWWCRCVVSELMNSDIVSIIVSVSRYCVFDIVMEKCGLMKKKLKVSIDSIDISVEVVWLQCIVISIMFMRYSMMMLVGCSLLFSMKVSVVVVM